MVLRFLIIALFSISQCYGNFNPEEAEKVLTKILEEQLNVIKTTHGDVETIGNEIIDDKKVTHGVSHLELENVPMPCLSLAEATEAPCPNLAAVIQEATVLMDKTTQIVIDAIKAFNAAFVKQGSQCTATSNPITAFRCFLRAFHEAYDALSSLKQEALELKEEVQKMQTVYNEYRTGCKTPDTHIQMQLQLLELCKKVHSS